jgi:hypothetical protein
MCVFIFSVFLAAHTGCIPTTITEIMDPRQPGIKETYWSWYSDDSVYLTNGSPRYVKRVVTTTCFETLYFQAGLEILQRDSCGTAAAVQQVGLWSWPQGDSLQLAFSGAAHNQKSFRLAGDTLQLFDPAVIPRDSISGQPVRSVRTYLKK